MSSDHDAILTGAGPAGECSYRACMPTKTLPRPGEELAAARRVGAREAVTGELDVAAAPALARPA